MPELPEVETVKTGLNIILKNKPKIKRVKVLNSNLRFEVPNNIKKISKGQEILKVKRRAKYLLFELPHYYISSHLGMTGTWRIFDGERKKHDHIDIYLDDGRILTYRDPRKFGFFEYFNKKENYHRFKDLGPEPLSSEFDLNYIWQKSRGRNLPVKNFIMDQKIVVGVGNIYAVESLFQSKIRPSRKSKNITKKEWQALIQNIKATLKKAIESGGSTISDFKQAGGDAGYFQHQFQVYGRDGQHCYQCQTILRNTKLGGRASVWCPSCQK